jgi:hypothetical protein
LGLHCKALYSKYVYSCLERTMLAA